MFRPQIKQSLFTGALVMFELIFHGAVRDVRKTNGNAVIGLLMAIVQAILMIVIFVFMMTLLGAHRAGPRGDFVLYIMTGIFNFSTHAKTLAAVSKSAGPTSTMMKHAPMNTWVAIGSAALSVLYLQTLSAAVILFFYHVFWARITIYDPTGVGAMYLLSWVAGIGVGMILKAATPWQPEFFQIVTMLYARANMIFSGKMFLANTMSSHKLAYYDWNPLFHCIDQARGFMFENYNPHNSSIEYPVIVTLVLIVLGVMGENFTRKHASASWSAGK